MRSLHDLIKDAIYWMLVFGSIFLLGMVVGSWFS